MTEIIQNREYRKRALKELIMELHEGRSVEEVRSRFEKLFKGVSAQEISDMEQDLIAEGLPVEEVQRLCDVHAAVFKGSIEEIHHPDETPGHPVHTFRLENKEIKKLIENRIKPHLEAFKTSDSPENVSRLADDFEKLWEVDKHYSRKENLLFPFLEKAGITAPPKVMWGVDDEIRAGIKGVREALAGYRGDKDLLAAKIEQTLNKVSEMVFKEENILFPMALQTLTEAQWIEIENESDEVGYCLTEPAGKWRRRVIQDAEHHRELMKEAEGSVRFETGALSAKEIEAIVDHLPVDITFVDKDDRVKYFSRGQERIFVRTKAVIGRKVQNCHPPGSVHIVEKLVSDFKSGKKDHEDFWIRLGEAFVYIRYFAVRGKNGEYLGTLEVTQNIAPIMELKGEKRLVTD
ncbi:MAG: DUF438 domain-containing protein [Bacillota bacterium]